ncbi:MAG TPA: hypothetical protein VFL81_01245 [Candidatus Saccharimonadales bacterium]|nr:hypothetical protein [Candidatus Saccharimonadales bacterium]
MYHTLNQVVKGVQIVTRKFLNKYTVGGLLALILLGAAWVLVHPNHQHVKADVSASNSNMAPNKLQFTFSGVQNWREGPVNATSIALFHESNGCFVSVEHGSGTIATDKANRQKTEIYLSDHRYKTESIGTETLTMQANDSAQEYKLHQSRVTTPAGQYKVKGGEEIGYISLADNSYIKAEGHCSNADQLPTTIPALQAIRFYN